jgi:hypothetical protein
MPEVDDKIIDLFSGSVLAVVRKVISSADHKFTVVIGCGCVIQIAWNSQQQCWFEVI